MAGVCVEKIYHSSCGEHLVQVFQNDDGTFSGFCYPLNKFVPNPYDDKEPSYKPEIRKKTDEEIQQELDEISSCQTLALPERKLRVDTVEYFEVKVSVSEQDGVTPVIHHYPYYKEGRLVAYKNRLIENKRMWSTGNQRDVSPFGWKQAITTGRKKLFICEGEVDAMSLFQILKDNAAPQWSHINPSVISLAHGASSAAKSLAPFLSQINEWEEVILVFDMDDAGKAAVEEVLKIIPKAKVANLPEKDVNDCLLKGKAKAAQAAVVFGAKEQKNTRLVSGASLHAKAKVATEPGLPWPWESMNKMTKGIRTGETIYIGAGQKQGKSEVVNTLAAWCMEQFGWKVFLCKPEEGNEKTYKLIAGKFEGKKFNDPDVEFDEEAFDRAGEKIGDKLFMLNLYQHVGWETLKGDIVQAAKGEGCKAIFIDPITNLTNGMTASAANEKLQEIAQDLSALALDLDVVIFIFCHLKNPDSGLPHERGGEVLSSQFAGSRAMARSCNLMIGIEGNRDPNLTKEERNVRQIVVLENREFGEVGKFSVYWDERTTLFNEIAHA